MERAIANNTYNRIKRLLSLLLCIVMFTGSFQVYAADDEIKSVAVKYNGEAVERLTLPENERAELTADCTPNPRGAEYRWQILADPEEELWVNIYDGTNRSLSVSYAMLQSLLDASGSVYLRCRASYNGNSCLSKPVCVTVEYIPSVNSYTAGKSQSAAAPKKSVRKTAVQSGEEEQFVSIIINYLDGVSGLPIYSAYTGRVNVSEKDYNAKVISPTYLGYAAMYNKNEPARELPDSSGADHSALFPDSATTIELNITKDTPELYTVNVYYFAIDVPYAVRFYFQNIHDDLYTEDVGLYKTDTAKTGTIISNEKLAELAGEIATVGFTKLYHYPEAVAADGSTVFECYYDRNYRMLKFDTNGGYGVEPIYARYGTPFLVNEPTRHGYVFGGWDKLDASGVGDNKKDELPSTVPDENCTYRAIWVRANTTYDVAYWLQNADNDDYAYIGTVEMKNVLSGSEVEPSNAPVLDSVTPICGNTEAGHTHVAADCYARHAKHYVLDDKKNAGIKVTVNGDGSSVLNVYYTRKYYTLRFIYAREKISTSGWWGTTTTTYSVVGGSTYGFGNKDYNDSFLVKNPDYSLGTILGEVTAWGDIEDLPTPNKPTAKNGDYVTGTYTQTGGNTTTNYHYFEITARYGADLTELWPVSVFDKVKVKNPSTHTTNEANKALANDGWGNYAFLAGWNGEYKVQYSISNSNSTVKGLYQKLDDSVLLGSYNGTEYDYTNGNITRQITTKTTVGGTSVNSNVCYFLAFFDNGADISWSVPREWIYESFVPVFSDEAPVGSELYNAIMAAADNSDIAKRTYTDPETKKVYYYYRINNQIYRLYDRVIASDDNTLESDKTACGQTQTVLSGFAFDSEYSNKAKWFEQFENDPLSDGRKSFTSRFFYTRDTFTITLHSHGDIFNPDGKNNAREFDSPMDDYMVGDDNKVVEPPYPETLEENAYYFDGWYASPECVEGTEYIAGSGYKMPAVNVALYAKWSPKTHKVWFFQTHDDLLKYQANGDKTGLIGEPREVKHGQVLGSVSTPIDKSEYHYSFGGWFYDYAGKRYAYTPLDAPVLRDLYVFAAWGSLTAQPFLIHYALDAAETDEEWTNLLAEAAGTPKDNVRYTVSSGTEKRSYVYLKADGKFHLCIADDTEGFAYQGSTRTFSPKAGDPYNQLYRIDDEKYNKGYYPTVASHSITMQYEEDKENPKINVFTFTYVYKEKVEYRVEYRYADTGNKIPSAPGGGAVTKETKDGVVTERFAVIENYIPDAFYKRLIIAVEKDENGEYVSASTNVIIFYYTKNETSAYYAVHYMLQNLNAGTDYKQVDGEFVNYTESTAHTEGIGTVGTDCRVPPQTFSGFTVQNTALVDGTTETKLQTDSSGSQYFNIEITANGTELYIFYTRNTQNYKVYYLEYGTNISNLEAFDKANPSIGVLYDTKSGEAEFGATVTETAANIIIPGMTCISALTQSILIRSNDKQNYIIFYYTPVQMTIEYKVWKYGGGTLDRTIEVFDAEASTIEGSTALPTDGYTFEGWYLDEACTQPADGKGTIDDTHISPNTNLLDVMPKVNVFYAKFLPKNGSLTIIRDKGENDESGGEGKQVFVYKIQAKNDPSYVLYVTVTGNGSTVINNLPCREYTVEQQNGWSWRYEDSAKTVTVEEGGTTVRFENPAAKSGRLNGNSKAKTNRKG